MPGLHLHRSNRLESLADTLGALLREPLPSVLATELIVVPEAGVGRWLSLELASRLGIVMNCRFLSAAEFTHEVFRAAFAEVPAEDPFAEEVLVWRILAHLPKLAEGRGSEALRRYLGNAADELAPRRAWDLARRIAAAFARHLEHRPELLLEWAGSRAGDWPARLWRELVRDRKMAHPPALLGRLQERVRTAEVALPRLPPRVAIFGFGSLPPAHLHLLGVAAHCLELHLFLMEPSDQYWGDIQSAREQERFLQKHDARGGGASAFHLDSGNPLLASLGKPGRAFVSAVQELEAQSYTEHFTAPGEGTRLGRIQADVFHLREGGGVERGAWSVERLGGDAARTLDARRSTLHDPSLQIHSCHSPLRELEVLHDRLLDLLERLPDLAPRDILVALPDVELYAPLIDAVFGAPEEEATHIPYTIADRSVRSGNAPAHALLEILALHGTRFPAAAVLAILELEPVRRRFALSEDDLDRVRTWVERSGIRWGIDGAHRASLDLPSFEQNTWRAGLDRLLLGYALPGDGAQLFAGLLPVPEVEGSLALALGEFADFADKLFTLIPALSADRAPDAWAEALRGVLDAFCSAEDEWTDALAEVRAVLAALASRAAHFPAPVPFAAVRAHLAETFAETAAGSGFLAGAVTFCTLQPGRALPFRVVCLLGMNDGAFPRRDAASGFDLLAGDPRSGDFSRRDEDRQLFLDHLLAAREVLYLSSCTPSQKDGALAAPSVVVTELLDYMGSPSAAPESAVISHRLHAFAPAYFDGSAGLFSYSSENADAARASLAPRPFSAPGIGAPLPEPEAEWHRVDLARLADFFIHPARFFLRHRLGLRLPDEETPADDCEPMALDGLSRWRLQHELAERLLAGGEGAESLPLARASGLLPAGHAGESAFHALCGELRPMIARVLAERGGPALAPQTIEFAIGEWQLRGTLAGIHPAGLVRVSGWQVKARDYLSAWIAHLARNAAPPRGDSPRETRLFATDARVIFRPVEDASALLGDLLALFHRGLRAPLPFFAATSFEFAARTLRPLPEAKKTPLEMARAKWLKKESADQWDELCFRHAADPLDEQWQELALRICQPMFDHATGELPK